MRDYAGCAPATEPDGARRDKFLKIDYFLRDLSRAMGRIQLGQVPDGSGDPIGDNTLSDLYWLLKGRSGNQLGYGGTAPGGTATLSSTSHPTKGKVYLGSAKQTAYDEVNERLGVNQPAPSAKVHILQTGDIPTVRKASGDNGTTQGYPLLHGYYEDDPALGPTYIGGVTNAGGPNSDYWGIYTSSGGSPIPVYHNGWQNVAADDGYSSFIAVNNGGPGTGTRVCDFLLDGVVLSASTWQLTLRICDLFNAGIGSLAWFKAVLVCDDLTAIQFELPAGSGAGTLGGSVVGSAWQTVTLSGTVVGTGTVANSVRFSQGGATTAYVSITYFSFTTSTGGLSGTPLQKWEISTTDNTLNFVSDGSSGTDLELTGDAPLMVTAGDDTSGLRITNATALERMEVGTSAGAAKDLVICGNRGTKATSIRLATDGVYLGNVAGTSTAVPGAILDIVQQPLVPAASTLGGIKVTPAAGQTNPAIHVRFAAEDTRIFSVDPSGTITLGSTLNDTAGADVCRLSIRVPHSQATQNIAQVVRAFAHGNNNVYTAWSVGYLGGNVFGDQTAYGKDVKRIEINQGNGQTVDLVQIGNYLGTLLVRVDKDGKLVFTNDAGATPLQIVNGAALNKVLSSDAAGNASWQTAASLGLSGKIVSAWVANGPYRVDDFVDGDRIVDTAHTVTGIRLWRRTAGASGTTTVHLYKNGVTAGSVSITSANGDNYAASATVSVAVAVGDKLSAHCTAVEAGAPLDYVLQTEGS